MDGCCRGSVGRIGGSVEAGQTVEGALVRELGEAIGGEPRERGEAIYHLFVVTEWSGGAPSMRNHEHDRLGWFGVEKACALPELALEAYRDIFLSLGN